MLVSVGAGFDVRALRVADGLRCAEIDLPDVVSQKRALLARTAPVPVSRLAGGAPRSCALDIGGFVELTVSLRAKAPKPPKRRRRGGEKGHEKGAGAADAGAPAAALLGPSDGAQL